MPFVEIDLFFFFCYTVFQSVSFFQFESVSEQHPDIHLAGFYQINEDTVMLMNTNLCINNKEFDKEEEGKKKTEQ